jgi:predicted HicB family RNase H-like nuclease
MPRKTTPKGKPMDATGTELKAVRLELPVETHRELRIEAAKQGVSMATLARQVIEAFLAKLAGPKPPTKKGGKEKP